MKTLIFALLIPLPLPAGDSAGADQARGFPSDHPAYIFALCAGRLSALTEHQWLVDGPASVQSKRAAARMAEILQASLRPDELVAAMALRVEAKAAHRALLAVAEPLSHVTTGSTAAVHHAKRRAMAMIGECHSMMLGW